MAFVTFEDLTGSIEVIVFPELYRTVDALLKTEHPLLVKGKLSIEEKNGNRLLASDIVPIERGYEIKTPEVHITCPINRLTQTELGRLQRIIKDNPGKSKVFMHIVVPNTAEAIIGFGDAYMASASPLLVSEMESVFGKQCVSFR